MMKKIKKIKKAVIPAAGYGTRFLPATKAQPKEMLSIVDKPAIQYIVEEAIASGIEEILIITGRNKRAIEDHFDGNIELEEHLKKKEKWDDLKKIEALADIPIHYIRQRVPRGLGDAIYCAKTFIGDEPFAIMLGDDIVYNAERPCLKQLIDVYEQHEGAILGMQHVAKELVSSYGIIDGNLIGEGIWQVSDLVEKPPMDKAPSNIAVLGRYIMPPEIFQCIEEIGEGAGGEVQLTDAIKKLTSPIYAMEFKGRHYDIGSRQGYLEASIEYALRNPELKDKFQAYLDRLYLGKK